MKLINLALEGKQMKAAYERARAKLKENAAKAVEVQTPQRRRTPSAVESQAIAARLKTLAKNPNSSAAAVDVLSQFD
jgi:hypothetical protein